MNKLFIILFTFLSFISCKKDSTHKLKYLVEFEKVPEYGYSNQMSLLVSPVYPEDNLGPAISPRIADKNREWDYEYWELSNGDKIQFGFGYLTKGYVYKLYIYIDDELVSYKEVAVVERLGSPEHVILDEYGLDDKSGDKYIDFTFNEE